MMERFEYDITRHSVEMFTDLAFLCTEEGMCQVGRVPAKGLERISDLLNHRGEMGWELIQVTFARDGVLAFWKRVLHAQVLDMGADHGELNEGRNGGSSERLSGETS